MVQKLLPLFPDDITLICPLVGVQKRKDMVYYFNGAMPIFQHPKDDYDSFRWITAQLVVNGNCGQMDIVRCFGVSVISMKRWVKRYRESKGLDKFVSKKKPYRTEY